MTIIKLASAVLGAFLIFLLGNWAAETLYSVGGHDAPAYVIDTGAGEEPAEEAEAAAAVEPAQDAAPVAAETAAATPAPAVPEPPATATQAPAEGETPAPAGTPVASAETPTISGDIEAGKKIYKKCSACHKLEAGKNVVGPYLYGVVGRAVASVDGFKYSAALSGLGGEWTVERLDAFLTKPADFAKGTKMTFAGLPKPEDRQNVIAYLDSVDN